MESRACWAGKAPGGEAHTCSVSSHPKDASPYGVLDLQGNVSELTSSAYCSYPKTLGICRNDDHVVRGGAWNDNWANRAVWARSVFGSTSADPAVGFRCAR